MKPETYLKWGGVASLPALAFLAFGMEWVDQRAAVGAELTSGVRWLLVTFAVLSISTSVGVLFLAWRGTRASLAELRAVAERMSQGDFSRRTRFDGDAPVDVAGHSLDRLAENLEATLAELHRERAVQGQILEGMQEGVLVLDRDGRIVMMNPAFRAMLLLGTEAKGRLLIEVVRHAELHEILNRALTRRTTALGEIDLPGIKPRPTSAVSSPSVATSWPTCRTSSGPR